MKTSIIRLEILKLPLRRIFEKVSNVCCLLKLMTSLLQMWWKGIQSLSEFDILQHLLNPGYGYDTSHLRPIKPPNYLFIDVQGGAEVLRQKLYYQYQNIFSLIYILGAIVFHKLIFRIYLNTNVLGLQGSLSLQCSNILVQKMRETSIAKDQTQHNQELQVNHQWFQPISECGLRMVAD